jgi:hypothetical protein
MDQMVSSNPYYVMLNGFMFFTTRGLRKNLTKNPAGHPERNTYRLVPFSTHVRSQRTVPLKAE